MTSLQLEFRGLARELSNGDSVEREFSANIQDEDFFSPSPRKEFVEPVNNAEDLVIDLIKQYGLDGSKFDTSYY